MPRFAGFLIAAAAVFAAVPPAPAQAGTYRVLACATDGAQWTNRAWTGPRVAGFVVDTDCTSPATLIGLRIDGGRQIANGASASLTFTSPPGTAITDFSLDRYLDFRSNPPLEGTRPLFALFRLGTTVFAGAGDYHTPTRDHLKTFGAWYGHPARNATVSRRTSTLRQMGALAGYQRDARTLSIQVGCFKRLTNCSAPAGSRVYHVLYGATVTVDDRQAPTPTITAEGLLAGGPRHGTDPVVMSATDNAGIRRVELLDVTAEPLVVGARDVRCDARLARPCPNLGRTVIAPTALAVGRRQLVVRTVDAGGNAVDRGPFPVDVITPSDRGAPNGSGASEPATLTARFTRRRHAVRPVRYGKRVRIRGRLRNALGAPIAGAQLELLTRNRRPGARTLLRKTTTTRANGRYSVRTRARASRTVTIGWKSHLNDAVHAATARVTLRARAAARLRASTRRPAVGRRLVLRGRLQAPARGVTVLLQGRAAGAKRFTTFADTTTGRRGRFSASYRFRDPNSRGRTFVFRAKLKPGRRYPFETGHSRRVRVRVR